MVTKNMKHLNKYILAGIIIFIILFLYYERNLDNAENEAYPKTVVDSVCSDVEYNESSLEQKKLRHVPLYDIQGQRSKTVYYESDSYCNVRTQKMFSKEGNLILKGLYEYDTSKKIILNEKWDFLSGNGEIGTDGFNDYDISYVYNKENKAIKVNINYKNDYINFYSVNRSSPFINLLPFPKSLFSSPRTNIMPSHPKFSAIFYLLENYAHNIQNILQNREFNDTELNEITKYVNEFTITLDVILETERDYCVGFLHIMNLAFGYKHPLLAAHSYDAYGNKIIEHLGIIPLHLDDTWLLPTSNSLMMKHKIKIDFKNIDKENFINIYKEQFENAISWYQTIKYSQGRLFITFLYTKTSHWNDIQVARQKNRLVMPNSHIAEILGSTTRTITTEKNSTLVNVLSEYRYSLDSMEETEIELSYIHRKKILISILPFISPIIFSENGIIPVTENMLDEAFPAGTKILWHDILVLDYVHRQGFVRGLLQMLLSGVYLPIAILQYEPSF